MWKSCKERGQSPTCNKNTFKFRFVCCNYYCSDFFFVICKFFNEYTFAETKKSFNSLKSEIFAAVKTIIVAQ